MKPRDFRFIIGAFVIASLTWMLEPFLGDGAAPYVVGLLFAFIVGISIGHRAGTGRWPDFGAR